MRRTAMLASSVVLIATIFVAAQFTEEVPPCTRTSFPVLKTDEVAGAAKSAPADGKAELATFGTGCFWCTEAVFQQIEGRVESGVRL